MNTNRYLELEVRYSGVKGDAADEVFDVIAEAFVVSKGLIDADLAMDTEKRTLTFSATLPNEVRTEDEALLRVLTAARAAIHACGGVTASWDQPLRMLTQSQVEGKNLIDA